MILIIIYIALYVPNNDQYWFSWSLQQSILLYRILIMTNVGFFILKITHIILCLYIIDRVSGCGFVNKFSYKAQRALAGPIGP